MFRPCASAWLIFAAPSEGRATKNWLIGIDVPAVVPLVQLAPDAFVRNAGTNTRYLPAPSTYRNGFSRETGVDPSVVYGGLGKLCAGAPWTPENTMFQTEPVQLPNVLSREY